MDVLVRNLHAQTSFELRSTESVDVPPSRVKANRSDSFVVIVLIVVAVLHTGRETHIV